MVAVSLKKFFFKQKTAYEICGSLVGSEMCIRDRAQAQMCMCWIIPANSHKCESVRDCWHACGGGFSVEPCYFQVTVLEVETIPNNNRIKHE